MNHERESLSIDEFLIIPLFTQRRPAVFKVTSNHRASVGLILLVQFDKRMKIGLD